MSLKDWLRCPVCDSPNVSYHDMARPAEAYTWLEVSCADCPASHTVHVNLAVHDPGSVGHIKEGDQ